MHYSLFSENDSMIYNCGKMFLMSYLFFQLFVFYISMINNYAVKQEEQVESKETTFLRWTTHFKYIVGNEFAKLY